MTPLLLEKTARACVTDRHADRDVVLPPVRVRIARPGRPAARILAGEYSAAHLDSVT